LGASKNIDGALPRPGRMEELANGVYLAANELYAAFAGRNTARMWLAPDNGFASDL
jgi:hypothetical protein